MCHNIIILTLKRTRDVHTAKLTPEMRKIVLEPSIASTAQAFLTPLPRLQAALLDGATVPKINAPELVINAAPASPSSSTTVRPAENTSEVITPRPITPTFG